MRKNLKMKNFTFKQKTKEIIDYFPRNEDTSDYTYNIAKIDTKNKDYNDKTFLNKKRKQMGAICH
jgi:hypothetical protein